MPELMTYHAAMLAASVHGARVRRFNQTVTYIWSGETGLIATQLDGRVHLAHITDADRLTSDWEVVSRS